ncbi:MAG: LPS export ABC transporter ATP-binding protein [Nitrospinota bacterium]|nr:LPS export ABC transporter ATP-binding protein [Nitrospinota bacterium]
MLLTTNLYKTYSNRTVVNDVSIEIKSGEIVGLLGPNGAGKTTVFSMISGLIQADYGEVLLNNRRITQMPVYERARFGLGYLPQESSIFRRMTVAQNVMSVLELMPYTREEREKRLKNLLGELKISAISSSKGFSLSGGERRRVEIARSLAMSPSFLLMDEPFSGIDPIVVAEIQTMVRGLTRFGIGVLITDHNVREALNVADRAYILHEGQIIESGKPNELIDSKKARAAYLGDNFKL